MTSTLSTKPGVPLLDSLQKPGQGDGTASIFQREPNVFTVSVHAAANFPARKVCAAHSFIAAFISLLNFTIICFHGRRTATATSRSPMALAMRTICGAPLLSSDTFLDRCHSTSQYSARSESTGHSQALHHDCKGSNHKPVGPCHQTKACMLLSGMLHACRQPHH